MHEKPRLATRRAILRRGAQLAGAALAMLGFPRALGATQGGDPSPAAPGAGAAGAQGAAGARALAVTAVFGSGRRRGISETAGEQLLAVLERAGARIERHHLTELSYKGCRACMGCKSVSDRCVLADDLSAVLEAIRRCDALVLASSTYHGEISSQTKGLVDRMFSFYHREFWNRTPRSRLAPGKKLALVLAQGNRDASLYSNLGPRYTGLLTSEFGFVDAGLVRCVGIPTIADVEDDPRVEAAIRAVAGRLLEGVPEAGAGTQAR